MQSGHGQHQRMLSGRSPLACRCSHGRRQRRPESTTRLVTSHPIGHCRLQESSGLRTMARRLALPCALLSALIRPLASWGVNGVEWTVDRTRHWILGPQPSRRLVASPVRSASPHAVALCCWWWSGRPEVTLRRRNATARKGTKRAWASLSADQDRVTTCPER